MLCPKIYEGGTNWEERSRKGDASTRWSMEGIENCLRAENSLILFNYVMSRKNVQQTFMVLLFRRWLVKSSVDVYLTFNILQILLSIFEFIPQTMELLFSGRLVKSAEEFGTSGVYLMFNLVQCLGASSARLWI